MRLNILAFTAFLAVIAITAACGGPVGNNGTGANNTAGTNGNTSSSNLEVRTPTPEQTTNNAPTLSPVFKAYCAAMEKKDEAALRKIFSSDTVKFLDSEIKAQSIKPPTIVKYFEDEQVASDLCEVRNEQITGDSGVAEIKTKSIPNGTKIIFVKENGEWKLTNKFPSVESVTKTSVNTNTAK